MYLHLGADCMIKNTDIIAIFNIRDQQSEIYDNYISVNKDKYKIIDLSEKIGTYETSIQPFEDCCTIFVAKHPVTKPNLNIIQRDEHNLDDCIDELFKTAIETTEKIRIE